MAKEKPKQPAVELPKYKDDEFVRIKDEFKEIQECIGMYISYEETEGAIHLFKEIFNNATDECINENSPGNKIDVLFDENTGEIIVSDNGRGFQFDKMVMACTEKHTSTKFKANRAANKHSSGQNGVGLTITTALSDYLIMTAYRGFESKTIEFRDCNLTDNPIVTNRKERYGTIVQFKPSEKYLGPIHMTCDHILDWLRRMSYIMPNGLKIKFIGTKSDSEAVINRTYERVGLEANVDYLAVNLEFPPLYFLVETEEFDLEMAFSYDKTLDGSLIDSYCNLIHTVEGGNHIIACERSLCDYLSREARRLDPNSKYDVTFDDCRKGLVMAVNCRHTEPKLGAQAKTKVTNSDVQFEGKKLMQAEIEKYFEQNQAILRKIIAYLKMIARIRMDANKTKAVKVKSPTTFVDDADIKGFRNIKDRHWKGYCELLIGEGDSASDQINAIRCRDFQACYSVFGVIENSFEKSSDKIMQKPNMQNLIKVLGCGIGKDFDINRLRWYKVILMPDSDCDGLNICSLESALFARHLTPIVTEGRLFRALPPLYVIRNKLKNSDETYLYDKKECIELVNRNIASNQDILLTFDDGTAKELTKSEKMSWLMMNKNYQESLENLSKRTACDKYILEHVCYYYLLADGNMANFKKMIEKKFRELKYDNTEGVLSGSFEGTFISLIIDGIFFKLSKKLMSIISDNPSLYIGYKPKNSKDYSSNQYINATIGQFFDAMSVYALDIENRFKGLGQMTPNQLFESTIDPRKRRLLRLTMDNIDSTLDIMELLHGKKKAEDRRALLANADISYDDIDS